MSFTENSNWHETKAIYSTPSKQQMRPCSRGGNHSLFRNNENGKMTSVPRHPNIDDLTCAKICKQLDIPYPGKN